MAGFSKSILIERNDAGASSSSLARTALLRTALLALAGSGLGIFAIMRQEVTGVEIAVVVSSGMFGIGLVFTLLVFRKVKVQTLATVSTIYYALYLCSGMIVALAGYGNHENLFTYMVWFFPLLVFNKLVNSASISRFLARGLIIAPTVILVGLSTRFASLFPVSSLILAVAGCLSYICFGLMLNAVTRYREEHIIERERTESTRIKAEILESISDCFISLDSDFRLVYMNDAACFEFALERELALNGIIPQAIPHFFSPSMLAELRAAAGRASASLFEAQNQKQDLWYQMRCYPRMDGMSVHFRNITEMVLSRRELEAAHLRMRDQSELLDKATDAIFVQDMESRFVFWNRGAERLLGWTSEEVMGRLVGEFFSDILSEVRRVRSLVLSHGEWTGEIPKTRKDGRAIIVESHCTLVRDNDGNPHSILTINTDITDRKLAEGRIQKLALYDTLTGLPNRFLFRERLDELLAKSNGLESMGALLFIDMDDFKTLNDSSGHDIGDLLLKEVGLRLRSCVRKTDTVARFGEMSSWCCLRG